jgi:hypothetical protein
MTIPRLQHIRRRLNTGAWRDHYYHRPTRKKLPPPTDPNFEQAYAAAERQLAGQRPVRESDQPHQCAVATPLAPANDHERELASHAPDTDNSEVYYTPEEVVQRWRGQTDAATLRNWRSKRQGPTYHRFGRAILYRADLLADWERKNMIVCDPLAELSENRLGQD